MKKNLITTKKSGESNKILAEVPEPNQVASTMGMPVLENTTRSGMRGNMILFLSDRKNRVAERLNKRIEHL